MPILVPDGILARNKLNGVASLGYLVALRKHAREVAEKPAAWMPWNYRDTLMRTAEV
jgi:hypothetical protein